MDEKRRYVPFCMGEYDDTDVSCDGDPDGKTKAQRKACVLRDKCAALRLYIEETNKTPDDFVKVIPDPNGKADDDVLGRPRTGMRKFIQLLNEQQERYGIVNGVSTKDPKAPPKKIKKASDGDGRFSLSPSSRALKKAAKAARKRCLERKKIMKRMFEYFKGCLIESLVDYKFTQPGGSVSPGKFYVVDRSENSSYVSIYCKTLRGRDAAVALVKYKTRSLTFDIELPVEHTGYSGISEKKVKKLKPKPIVDGMFKSIVMGLNKEGMALAAETIAQLVKSGKIQLPAADGSPNP